MLHYCTKMILEMSSLSDTTIFLCKAKQTESKLRIRMNIVLSNHNIYIVLIRVSSVPAIWSKIKHQHFPIIEMRHKVKKLHQSPNRPRKWTFETKNFIK